MCIVARAAAAVPHRRDIFGWSPTQFSERIETAEHQAAIIAKDFTQTCYTGQHDAIVVIALNPRTITSWANHGILSVGLFSPPERLLFNPVKVEHAALLRKSNAAQKVHKPRIVAQVIPF